MNRHLGNVVAVVLILAALTSTRASAQGEASRYIVLRNGAATINPKTDYFSVTLVQGWLSKRSTFLETLLSSDTKSSILVQSAVTFFDGQKIENALTFSNSDIKKNVDKSWGITPLLYEKLPGDAAPDLTLQVGIYRADNFAKILSALDASKASLPADVISSPVVGYARAVSGVFSALFGTDATKYPFIWQGSVKAASPAITATGMKEHYIVLIAPRDRNDQTYKTLNVSNLAFDEANQRLTYNNSPVVDWSFAVLAVQKVDPYNIDLLMNGQSNAPWAVLGVNVFRAIPTGDASKVEQLQTLAKNLVAQLNNMTDLLKRELRFSAYSRAVTVASLATRSRDQIKSRCNALTISDAQCPTTELDQIANSAGRSFGLRDAQARDVTRDAQRIKTTLFRGPRR